MMPAGTSQLTTEGRKSAKKPENEMMPFCHTIRVVMSPKGENAPPALAATTTLIKASNMKRALSAPTAMTTAPISNAVVRLSAMGLMKNASRPVIQKTCRRLKPFETSHTRSASNTPRSSMVLM
jgi:hypothetical protein